MNRIILRIESGQWVADFTDPEVLRVFGTRTLPTPYRSTMQSDRVLAEIIKRNPDCTVSVRI